LFFGLILGLRHLYLLEAQHDSTHLTGTVLNLTSILRLPVNGMTYGSKELKEFVEPWANSDREVCGDSFFASVKPVRFLRQLNVRFIDVVKTAPKK
jgi:hypothetical protein